MEEALWKEVLADMRESPIAKIWNYGYSPILPEKLRGSYFSDVSLLSAVKSRAILLPSYNYFQANSFLYLYTDNVFLNDWDHLSKIFNLSVDEIVDVLGRYNSVKARIYLRKVFQEMYTINRIYYITHYFLVSPCDIENKVTVDYMNEKIAPSIALMDTMGVYTYVKKTK